MHGVFDSDRKPSFKRTFRDTSIADIIKAQLSQEAQTSCEIMKLLERFIWVKFELARHQES